MTKDELTPVSFTRVTVSYMGGVVGRRANDREMSSGFPPHFYPTPYARSIYGLRGFGVDPIRGCFGVHRGSGLHR